MDALKNEQSPNEGEPDLLSLQRRINISRKRLLEASKLFNPQGEGTKYANDVVSRFLEKFSEPNDRRSEISRNEAREAVRFIKEFLGRSASMLTSVAMANIALETRLLGLHGDAWKAVLRDLMPTLERGSNDGSNPIFDKRALLWRAATYGECLDKIHGIVADIYFARYEVLASFWLENVKQENATNTPKLVHEMAREAVPRLLKIVPALVGLSVLAEMIEAARGLAETYQRLLKVVKEDPNALAWSSTDTMQLLLEALRKEKIVFEMQEKLLSSELAKLISGLSPS
jgi:hypothetical protein